MNILLFGKTGQVGWELQRALAPLGDLIALDVHSIDYCGDFSNPEGIAETVRAIKPDVIVNAAAHTAVDKAESEQETAQRNQRRGYCQRSGKNWCMGDPLFDGLCLSWRWRNAMA